MTSKFDSLTNYGLEKLLNRLLSKPIINKEDKLMVNEIVKELQSRKGRLIGLNKEEQIKIILDGFDFNHVHDVFVIMGYTLYMGAEGFGVPSVEYLKNLCEGLLNNAWDMEQSDTYHDCSTATARFKATRSIYDGYKILGLEFIPISMVLDYYWVVDGE